MSLFDNLDPEPQSYALSSRYGWCERAMRPRRDPPKRPTMRAIRELSSNLQESYVRHRATYNANITVATFQVQELHAEFDLVVETNMHDAGRVRPPIVLNAWPGIGKTTAVVSYGATFHKREIDLYGDETPLGIRLPVVYIALSAAATTKTLNVLLAQFFDIPENKRNAHQLASAVSVAVRQCGTRLIILDDIHFLDLRRKDGRELANHLKWLSNEFPVTFLYVGVGLKQRGLLREGLALEEARTAQIARRTTEHTLRPFTVHTDEGSEEWRAVLGAIEQRLLLARLPETHLSDTLSDYLYERSSGHFASLTSLLTRGCMLAMKSGTETLTKDDLERIRIDAAAEASRAEMVNQLELLNEASRKRGATRQRPKDAEHDAPLDV